MVKEMELCKWVTNLLSIGFNRKWKSEQCGKYLKKPKGSWNYYLLESCLWLKLCEVLPEYFLKLYSIIPQRSSQMLNFCSIHFYFMARFWGTYIYSLICLTRLGYYLTIPDGHSNGSICKIPYAWALLQSLTLLAKWDH